MTSSCVKFSHFPTCGYKGFCINETVCVCDGRLTQNSEWSFFLDDLSKVNTLPCYSSEEFVKAIYFILALLSFFTICMHVPLWKRKKARQRLPAYLFLLFTFPLGLRRFLDENALFAQDSFHTFLLVMSFGNVAIMSTVYAERYLQFHIQKLQNFPMRDKRQALTNFKLASRIGYLLVFWRLVEIPFLFSTLYVPRQTASYIIRISFGISAISGIFHLFLNHYLLTWLTQELDWLLNTQGVDSKKLQATVRELKSRRFSVDTFNLLNNAIFLATLFSDFMLSLMLYFFPLLLLRVVSWMCLMVVLKLRQTLNTPTPEFSSAKNNDSVTVNVTFETDIVTPRLTGKGIE